MSSKRWCFTVNNYTDDDIAALDSYDCKYMVYGKEEGESKTPHLQGFLISPKMQRLSAMKKLNARAHWEPAKGTSEEASAYCKKDGKFTERGSFPKTRKERGEAEADRWELARTNAKRGKFDDIPHDIYIKYCRNLHFIASQHQVNPEPLPELDNWWYYGETGTGKSRAAREENPGYYEKNTNKWWDGYVDQDVVIIEEWNPELKMLGNFLKKWADHHPFSAEVKGGTMSIRPKKIIITSNYSMEQCFEDPAVLGPLRRRFKVKKFEKLLRRDISVDEYDITSDQHKEEFVADTFTK